MDARLRQALSDRYVVERELGAGATATVWLARDLKHDRQVAIKVLHPELAAVVGAERFLKEIRTTAQIQHPNILPLFDSGSMDGQLFYVMPFVDGETLRARIVRETQLPIHDAVRITSEICSALDYSHRHGVIHRDIKPENILLHDGRAIVADFGIAYSQSPGEQRLTETGLAVGTPAYMSPEQALGSHTIDARSDIYSVGAVLYEMLTGVPPFVGPSAQAIVARVITKTPVHASRLRRGVPPHVDYSVMTALQKDPARRFATAAAMQVALEGTEGTRTGAHRRVRRALGAIAALAIIAGAAYLARHRPAPGNDLPSLSIAAVPFQIQDSADAYLGDQMPQEILDALTHVPGLTVRPLASAPRFRREHDLATIGNALQVGTLLTGTVRREGRSIRITARLYDVMRNVSLRSVSFTNSADNKFALEDSVSSSIVADFNLTQSPRQLAEFRAQRTTNPVAHDTLMLARWYTEQRTPHALSNAIRLFKEAIQLDSTYAEAWAGLASALNYRGVFGDSTSAPYLAEAKNDALRAISLDNASATAHTSYGFTKVFYDRDYAGAITELNKALALDSSQSATWLFRGWAYLGANQVDSAVRSMRRGWRVDPGSLIVGTRLAYVLKLADSVSAAEQVLDAVLKQDNGFLFARTELAKLYAEEHRCKQALDVDPVGRWAFGSAEDLLETYAVARCGQREYAVRHIDSIEVRRHNGAYANAFGAATVYAALQDREGVMRWLNIAVDDNEWTLFMVRHSPAFKAYRNDRAFLALLRRARL